MDYLPVELTLEIFGYLSIPELGISSLVSRSWHELCEHPVLWKSRYIEALTKHNNEPFPSPSLPAHPEEGYKSFLQKKLDNIKALPILRVSILVFKSSNARGNGTSMISMVIPPGGRIASFAKMLADEYGTRSNIKTRVGRLSVLSAITSVQQRLKMYREIPPQGLIIYCGTILTDEGKEKKVSIDFEPPTWKGNPIIGGESRYLCDNRFDSDFLKEAIQAPLAEIQESQSSMTKRLLHVYQTQPERFVVDDAETIVTMLEEGKVETLLCWAHTEWHRIVYREDKWAMHTPNDTQPEEEVCIWWKGKRADIPHQPPIESWLNKPCSIVEIQEMTDFLLEKVNYQPMTVLEIVMPPFDSSKECQELKGKLGGDVIALLHRL